MCNYWESCDLGKNVCIVLLIKRGFFKVKSISGAFFFSLKLVAVDLLLIPILQYANAHLSNILIFWTKKYCWHFWFKSHFSVLCGAFCNITFYFLLILTTVFKSNPKRLSISFYIPFVTWKMHYKHFWPKNNGYDAFSLNLQILNIYLLCIKQN